MSPLPRAPSQARAPLHAAVVFAVTFGSSACVSAIRAGQSPDGHRAGTAGTVTVEEGELCMGPLRRQCYATESAAPALPRSADEERAEVAKSMQACRAGDSGACNDTGVAYSAGVGAGVEPTLATELFMKACTSGSTKGCKNLGTQYRFGKAVDPNDPHAAARYYAIACDKGAPSGCYELAEMLRLGNQASPDPARAVVLYEQACAGGYGQACARLGYVYGTGANGVQKDQVRGYAKNRRGCELGSKNACAGVGFQMLKGLGTAKDDVGALRLLERICQQGGAAACVTLGRLYSTEARLDLGRAAQLFEAACDLMDLDGEGSGGCYFFGVMLRDGIRIKKNVARGTQLLHRACDVGGQAIACTALGLMYHQGTLVPVDVAKAVQLFDAGCRYGDPEGCTNLGAAYLTGEGVPADRAKATKLFKFGCERNVEKACIDLRVYATPAEAASASATEETRL